MNTFCIQKRVVYLALFVAAVSAGLFFLSYYVTHTNESVNSRASQPKKRASIFGGYNANADYVLKIELDMVDKNGTRSNCPDCTCTGVLIDKNHALTAAHCFSPLENSTSSATAIKSISNYYDSSSSVFYDNAHFRKSDDLTVITCMSIKGTNCPSINDLALIKIKTPYDNVTDFPLLTNITDDDYKEGNSTVVYGWGIVAEDESQTDPKKKYTFDSHLKSVSLPIYIDSTQGNPLILQGKKAGWFSPKKGTSAGDSGGPVIYKNKLIGIVYQSGDINLLTKALRVNDYLTWISTQQK